MMRNCLVPVQLMDQWLQNIQPESFVMKTIRDRFNDLLKTIDQLYSKIR